jgi:signal transduction histidine kinase
MSGSPSDFPSLKPGGHVCLPYAKEEEKHSAIAGFIHDGLIRGERCIYWGLPAGFAAMLPYLEARGVPVLALRERSTLVFADTTQPSASGFDLEHQSASIRDAVAAARSEGYAGLRVAGDPDQRMRAALNHEQLAAFEDSLSQLFGDVHATGLCAFDQRTTDASSLEVALATHEVAIVAGRVCENPFFKIPGRVPGNLSASERVAWMAANILETSSARDLLEAENAALILHSTRAGKRDAAYRRHIATLTRSIEARDRLLITAARWLSRPLPAMCGHLDELTKDEQLLHFHQTLETCGEHLSAIARLSQGLEEIASFLQMQVVLRPERMDLVEVARAAISELKENAALGKIEITLEGAEHVTGTWDRLRLTRLFLSLIRTAREQGYDARVGLRIDDLVQFARIRLEFMLPHAPALSDSGERARTLAYGPSGESDYERLAVHTWSAREIVRLMGGTLGISTWADARVVFTLDLPKTAPESLPNDDLPWS